MNAELVYQKMLEKANKSLTNGTVALDRARAVAEFNEAQDRFIEWSLQKRNSFDILDVQQLLKDKGLDLKEDSSSFSSFKLPEDYFAYSNVRILASKGDCSDYLQPIQIKGENVGEVLFDEFNSPSFYFRETPYIIQNNSILIYKKDFNLSQITLKYYRKPIQFNLEGYITETNQQSFSMNPEFDDRIVDRIITIATTSFDINNENLQKVQFDMNRTVSKY